MKKKDRKETANHRHSSEDIMQSTKKGKKGREKRRNLVEEGKGGGSLW